MIRLNWVADEAEGDHPELWHVAERQRRSDPARIVADQRTIVPDVWAVAGWDWGDDGFGLILYFTIK